MNGSMSFRGLGGFLKGHHLVIFIVVILLAISGVIFSLYLITDQVLKNTEQPPNTSADFNQETIEKIKKLHDSSDTSAKLVFPKPRSNPFIEK